MNPTDPSPPDPDVAASTPVLEVFLAFLKLGVSAFGGPVAHLGYFHAEFVQRRRWISEPVFADLVAMAQFLPGPASSQVGIALGQLRAGWMGAIAAWTAFTLPSAAVLMALGLGLTQGGLDWPAGLLHGLKLAAVAVVAQAVITMQRQLCPDTPRKLLALVAAVVTLLLPSPATQVGILLGAATIGRWLLHLRAPIADAPPWPDLPGLRQASTPKAWGWWALFGALLVLLPWLASVSGDPALSLVDVFYRVGSLVFGGGHVVLPMMQAEVVGRGWLDEHSFLLGYALTQAMPGPLFTFAAYLGTVRDATPNGIPGGLMALMAMFAPSFFMVWGMLPLWHRLSKAQGVRRALSGINAAVVGLLLAALWHPVATSAIAHISDAFVVVGALWCLMRWRLAPWMVVAGCALAGWLMTGMLPV